MTRSKPSAAKVVAIGRGSRSVPREVLSTRSRPRQPADEVRAAILEAARMLYAGGGYPTMTMGAIARQLGIKAPSLYHHFVSKEAIFRELQQQALALEEREIREPVPGDLENLREYFWRIYRFSKTHPHHFALLWADRSTPPFDWVNQSNDIVRSLTVTAHARVRKCIAAGILPRATDVIHVSNILWSAVHGVAMLRILNGAPEYGFDRLASDAIDTVLAGLRNPPRRRRGR